MSTAFKLIENLLDDNDLYVRVIAPFAITDIISFVPRSAVLILKLLYKNMISDFEILMIFYCAFNTIQDRFAYIEYNLEIQLALNIINLQRCLS